MPVREDLGRLIRSDPTVGESGGGAAAAASATSVRPLVTDPEILARIKALVIPPAWEDVWICADLRGPARPHPGDGNRRGGPPPVPPVPRPSAPAAGSRWRCCLLVTGCAPL
ncbi:MAG: hypothetical protein ACRDP7_48465 [Trebonia sp.]